LRSWYAPIDHQVEIIDSPPGASCPVVEAVRKADFLLLVTEPTVFGLHDLKQALQVARELQIPAGVVINRVGVGQEDIQGFCQAEGLPVLLEIPLDREIGEGLARGRTLLEIDPSFLESFLTMWRSIAGPEGGS
jgi:MinD superfamily P-loop ATPase